MIFPLPLLFVIGRGGDLWNTRLIDGAPYADGQSAQNVEQKPYLVLSENTACPEYSEQNVFRCCVNDSRSQKQTMSHSF
jgi:hypothetical protein